LKSPTATEAGKVPAGKLVGPVKVPAVLPSSTEMMPSKASATARSGSPSPLKSPTATANGYPPVAMLVAGLKLPPTPPSSTETLPANSFATARSGSPSPLKSPTATALGESPTAKLVGPVKVTGVTAAHAGGAGSRAAIRQDAARTARPIPRM
jgi:hypothetical protein